MSSNKEEPKEAPLDMSNKVNNSKPDEVEQAVKKGDEGNLKRPASKVDKDETELSSSTAKRSKKPAEVLDLALTMGIKAGDRLEVEWEIGDAEGKEEDVTTRWWGATLLEHDGKTEEEGVAIRVIEYDALPDHGFPEKSREEVIFISHDVLVDYETQDQLPFRLLSDDDSAVFWIRGEEIGELVNTILQSAMSKTAGGFNGLPRAQQAAVAEKIAAKKEKLVELLQNHIKEIRETTGNRGVVTAEDAQRLLAQAMMEG